ncbi:hypothetical protein SDC9_116542 [bioreactor metagenome]|uniref:AntA/AntB antirepressor domain-containing protein n=1 Tax=bioreactor metagenome TaxID=1076179 RepID=A0A645C6M0_9ZZZZ|nr:antA/AntB antirepressor family protein [Candidatus Metalachnospira sp.]
MNSLTLFEQGLVPLYQTDTGEYVVNGRELWEGLQSKRQFADWVKSRLLDCEAAENEDFDTLSQNCENGGKRIEYIIKLDTAKEMAMLERNEIGKQVRKYFIAVEKRSKQNAVDVSALNPEMQMFKLIFDSVAQTQLAQKQQQQAIENMDKRLDGIRDVVALNPNDWRKDTTALINKIALRAGGYEHLNVIREESYKILDERFGVSLSIRLTNLKKNMALNGVCKSKMDKLNKLDAIANDKKLIEGYISIVKEMSIKYGLDKAI